MLCITAEASDGLNVKLIHSLSRWSFVTAKGNYTSLPISTIAGFGGTSLGWKSFARALLGRFPALIFSFGARKTVLPCTVWAFLLLNPSR